MQLRKYIPELIVLVYAVLFLLTKVPSNTWDRVIVSDGKGYYAYLPALFIYYDSDFDFIDKYESDYYPLGGQLYKDFRFDTGNGIVNKYFPGPAVLWLPFFAGAHAIAAVFGFPTDGYSMPYQLAIAFAAFFYFWLSLLILRKILRFYTQNENAIAWTLLATGLATNLIYYTVNAGCQVHVYNFFLINAFVYSVLSANKSKKPVFFASSAFFLGMVVISRPQNGIIVLALPFLCGSWDSLILLLKKAFSEKRILFPSVFALILPLLIPVTYWYVKTGHFLVYSYGNETYDLTKPHLFSFLLSFEKGWLLYTPIAAFSAFGFVYLFKKNKWQFLSLSAFLFSVVYFLSSWWVWNYTSFVSQRVMIDYYAFIAILLVFIFKGLENSRRSIIYPLFLSVFIGLNLMQHFQHLIWVYPSGPVTAKTYFSNFYSFDKGTTFMVPENEILGKQSYSNDFEQARPLFKTKGCNFSEKSHSQKTAIILDSVSNNKPLFVRGMSDYKEAKPLILRIGGWFLPESLDSSLTIDVNIGTSKGKYSTTHHNLMPGLNAGKWKYAEMVVYLPYIRSVSDSLFVSFQNLSQGEVLLDDMQIDFLKMQPTIPHDWILPTDDQTDTAILYHSDMETELASPWGNAASITTAQSFSGKKSSCIQASSPYSIVFENTVDYIANSDGYIRVSSRIMGENQAEMVLVFDFTSNGKTVFYKTYPVQRRGNSQQWFVSEIFREFPVSSLKAEKVKIYYWYIKGDSPVYIDDMQVDMVKYKTAKPLKTPKFPENPEAKTIQSICCDFEQKCLPESGNIEEVGNAFSGKKACLIDSRYPFSFSHWLPLQAFRADTNPFIHISAKVNSDQYTTGATLVADFKHEGKTVSYHPAYLRGQTVKGQWNPIEFGVKIPEGITSKDSVLVYFYLNGGDEVLMIDDFCVEVKGK
jgi:hypothetical protein